jgi:predicted MFS family arabinose efflux permease
LPLLGLSALATAGFVTILTEALPAGLLPRIGADLQVSQAMVGQLVTAYALGSVVAAIPLTAATRRWRRRSLLMLAVGGFLVANAVTALSHSYVLTLAVRFAAGVFAGLVWALLAGYAGRMAPEGLRGRAIAVAMVGTPLALAIGIPAGTLLGGMIGWRAVFLILSGLSLLLVGWIARRVPDFPGQADTRRGDLKAVFNQPGLKTILAVTLAFVLAHNVLYTYIASLLQPAALSDRVDAALLLFGVTALSGIWTVGAQVDRRLGTLTLASIALFAAAALGLALVGNKAGLVLAAIAVWGAAFGGAATLFQTASARVAGEATDVAQSMIVTVWNVAIAGGGVIGALILRQHGPVGLSWSVMALLAVAALLTKLGRQAGFRN